LYVEAGVQLDGLQDGRAVLTRGDDGDFESVAAEVMDELDASRIRRHPLVFNGLVDQVVLAIPEPAYGFKLGGSSGCPSESWIPRDARKSRTPSKRGFPSTYSR